MEWHSRAEKRAKKEAAAAKKAAAVREEEVKKEVPVREEVPVKAEAQQAAAAQAADLPPSSSQALPPAGRPPPTARGHVAPTARSHVAPTARGHVAPHVAVTGSRQRPPATHVAPTVPAARGSNAARCPSQASSGSGVEIVDAPTPRPDEASAAVPSARVGEEDAAFDDVQLSLFDDMKSKTLPGCALSRLESVSAVRWREEAKDHLSREPDKRS